MQSLAEIDAGESTDCIGEDEIGFSVVVEVARGGEDVGAEILQVVVGFAGFDDQVRVVEREGVAGIGAAEENFTHAVIGGCGECAGLLGKRGTRDDDGRTRSAKPSPFTSPRAIRPAPPVMAKVDERVESEFSPLSPWRPKTTNEVAGGRETASDPEASGRREDQISCAVVIEIASGAYGETGERCVVINGSGARDRADVSGSERRVSTAPPENEIGAAACGRVSTNPTRPGLSCHPY